MFRQPASAWASMPAGTLPSESTPTSPKITYLVRPEDVAAAGAVRAKHFGDARPGSATIIVKALVCKNHCSG